MHGLDMWADRWRLYHRLVALWREANSRGQLPEGSPPCGTLDAFLWANGVGPMPDLVPMTREELDATADRHRRGITYFARNPRELGGPKSETVKHYEESTA